MRWSNALIPTLKETPAEAEVTSHKLMVRAGLIRRLGSGTYSYLPLGYRALHKVIDIIREEMDRAGAQQVSLPNLWPIDMLQKSGRDQVFGNDLVTFQDRRDRPHALAPTHEEAVTDLVGDTVNSYRELPINLYQVGTKVRDEPRPRFGLLRTREFLMKDAYSFDENTEKLQESYNRMYDAYCRIFDRCGLEYAVVEASSGAMGGGVSHEFMVPSEIGSDKYVDCTDCDYAANIEKAEVAPPAAEGPDGKQDMKEVETPGKSTIEEVSEFLDASPRQMIKTLIYMADDQPVAALVRGDHDLNETKLGEALECTSLELAGNATIEEVTGAPVGFAGPVGLDDVTLVCDPYVAEVGDGITGANRQDAHLTGVTPGEDFKPNILADIRDATDGDHCPRCEDGTLEMHDGIEVGHVFKLGTKYSKAADATFRDNEGNERHFIMGCYGIGVDRILAAAVETMADDRGIVWPPSICPYEVVVMPLNLDNEEVRGAAEEAYEMLQDAGLDVLMDDRDESPGFKFKDAELVGFPVQIVIGRGYQESGKYEIQLRDEDREMEAAPEDLVQAVRSALDDAP